MRFNPDKCKKLYIFKPLRQLIMLSFPDFKEKKHPYRVHKNTAKKSISVTTILLFPIRTITSYYKNTCYKTLAIWIVGGCTLSSGIMERSKKFAFPIYLLSYNFRCIGMWNSGVEGNFLLRHKAIPIQRYKNCKTPG